MEKETPKPIHHAGQQFAINWDLMKVMEPNGLDPAADEKAKEQLFQALSTGYEPFAVVPLVSKPSAFSSEVKVQNWLYLKRPSITSLHIDESSKDILV